MKQSKGSRLTVGVKENLGNQSIKALRQSRHWVWCMTHGRAIKEEP